MLIRALPAKEAGYSPKGGWIIASLPGAGGTCRVRAAISRPAKKDATRRWRFDLRRASAGTRLDPARARAVRICASLSMPIFRSTQILRFLVMAATRMPKLTFAVALLVLAALAGAMTYTGFLVVGVLADHLGTGRVIAGLLLGGLFARFPWISNGRLRIVGLLPKPVRRPLIVSLLALCLLNFLWRGDYVPAVLTAFATAFLLSYPWLRRAIVDRLLSTVFRSTGRHPPKSSDDMVIDAEFREKKE